MDGKSRKKRVLGKEVVVVASSPQFIIGIIIDISTWAAGWI